MFTQLEEREKTMKISSIISQIKLIQEKLPNQNIIKAFFTLLDIKYWQKTKKMLWNEYFWYGFDKKTRKEKLEYVLDNEVMNVIPAICNNEKYVPYLNEKPLFNKRFEKYLGREYGIFSKDTFDIFADFVKRHETVIIKPENDMGGHGIEKIKNDEFLLDNFKRITKNGPILAEEIIKQHPKMALLNSDSVNTIRIVTMRDDKGNVTAPLASVRIGRKGACVDNFCSGGMAAKIDIESGTIMTPAFDRYIQSFEIHPDSNVKIIGYHIPLWEKVIKCVLEASELLPECRYIGWDVAIGNDDNVYLIEGNSRPATDVFQIPAGKGLRSIYTKYLGLKN